MPAEGTNDNHESDDGTVVAELDTAAEETADGAVEYDERRAKMERLRAEGVEPYPPVTLWGRRARIADVHRAHDPSVLDAGEHPDMRYLVAGRLISRRHDCVSRTRRAMDKVPRVQPAFLPLAPRRIRTRHSRENVIAPRRQQLAALCHFVRVALVQLDQICGIARDQAHGHAERSRVE